MKKILNKTQDGFTLMEILVATSLFVVVAVGGLSVLLSSQKAYKRISSNVVATDNVNLVIDTMTREMKFGSFYGCVNTTTNGSFNRSNNPLYLSFDHTVLSDNTYGTCNAVAFTPQGTTTRKNVYYIDESTHAIREAQYLATGSFPYQTFIPDSGLTSPIDHRLTSDDFKVNNFWMNIFGTGEVSDGDFIQPRVEMSMSGIVDIEKNEYGQTISTTTVTIQSISSQKNLGN